MLKQWPFHYFELTQLFRRHTNKYNYFQAKYHLKTLFFKYILFSMSQLVKTAIKLWIMLLWSRWKAGECCVFVCACLHDSTSVDRSVNWGLDLWNDNNAVEGIRALTVSQWQGALVHWYVWWWCIFTRPGAKLQEHNWQFRRGNSC